MKHNFVDIKMFVDCPKRFEDVPFDECCDCEHFIQSDEFYNSVECSYDDVK